MNRIAGGLQPVVALHYVYSHPTTIPFAVVNLAIPQSTKPLAPESFTDAMISSGKGVYELNKLLLTVVSRFFERLISGSSLPQNSEVDSNGFVVIPKIVKDPKKAQKLGEALKKMLPTKVQYSVDKEPVELGTFIFEYLLEKGKGGVELDRDSGIYTVTFSEAKRLPITFNEDVEKKLNGRVVDPNLRHAQVVQFKLGKGNIKILGDSLTVSATVKGWPFGSVTVDATVEGMVGEAPDPFAGTHMLGAIRLNEGTNAVVRGLINNVICPLMNTDLTQIRVRREPAVRLLHKILDPTK